MCWRCGASKKVSLCIARDYINSRAMRASSTSRQGCDVGTGGGHSVYMNYASTASPPRISLISDLSHWDSARICLSRGNYFDSYIDVSTRGGGFLPERYFRLRMPLFWRNLESVRAGSRMTGRRGNRLIFAGLRGNDWTA